DVQRVIRGCGVVEEPSKVIHLGLWIRWIRQILRTDVTLCPDASSAVRPDVGHIRRLRSNATRDDACDRAREIRVELEWNRSAYRFHEVAVVAATGRSRMRVDDGFTSLEFFPHWSERLIAEPPIVVTGHETDAIHVQSIVRVLNFLQCGIDVRKRNR